MRALKLFTTLAAAAIVCTAVVCLPKKLAFECGQSYTFFVGNTSKDCRVVTVKEGANLKLLTLSNVCGEATTYSELDIDAFLQSVNGRVAFTEELSDSVNYYCTADLPYAVELYGQSINLHISVRGEGTTVASPIIFGGY